VPTREEKYPKPDSWNEPSQKDRLHPMFLKEMLDPPLSSL
jgi:hypothetical protein